jgi:hypothetical protein
VDLAPQRAPEGHVVAVRLTSENADDGFKPTAGRIDELHFRPTPEVGWRAGAGGRACCRERLAPAAPGLGVRTAPLSSPGASSGTPLRSFLVPLPEASWSPPAFNPPPPSHLCARRCGATSASRAAAASTSSPTRRCGRRAALRVVLKRPGQDGPSCHRQCGVCPPPPPSSPPGCEGSSQLADCADRPGPARPPRSSATSLRTPPPARPPSAPWWWR